MCGALSSPRVFISLLIGEVGLLYLLRWPLLYNFNSFGFWDYGSYLVAHYLLRQGGHPFTDFGWQYGLLPLSIQYLGLRVLGASPASFLLLSVPCFIAVAAIMGRIALVESSAGGRILVILTLPLVLTFEPDLPHSLEPVFLSLGLLCQVSNKLGRALAFATAACFIKPAMGYLYGLVLLVCILRRSQPPRVAAPGQLANRLHMDGWNFVSAMNSLRLLIPAAATGSGLILVLSAFFGWHATIRSLLPLSGARAYQVLHYGSREITQGLLHFPGVRPAYYIGTPVSFWACSTVYLIIAALFTLSKATTHRLRKGTNSEIVLSCAALHVGFILILYGSPASWTYYAYILVIGILATEVCPLATKSIGALCVLAALANYSGIRAAISAWGAMERDLATGLFISAGEHAEWNCVVSLAEREHPAVFTDLGAAGLLLPWLRRPTGAFFIPGIAAGREIDREERELRSATTVIVPTIPELENPIKHWPGGEFSKVFADATLVFKGTYFQVYKRVSRADVLQTSTLNAIAACS
jgi:hypothetical protein